ncbi:MAG: toll/interleukin-1 receptor domain-containing protein [Pseudomonadota bacterium]
MTSPNLSYGVVAVIGGDHVGRIGLYEDDDTEFPEDLDWDLVEDDDEVEGEPVAVVHFGSYLLSTGWYHVPYSQMRPASMEDLFLRQEALHDRLSFTYEAKYGFQIDQDERVELLYELHLVEAELVSRVVSARYQNTGQGQSVFLSHSSADKATIRWLYADLIEAGYRPWFDEAHISVGQSIPKSISKGVKDAEVVIVALSENSVESRWVETEWHAKYWDEVTSGQIQVLPVLLGNCEIPEFLKFKKYADFRESYSNGLDDLLSGLNRIFNSNDEI